MIKFVNPDQTDPENNKKRLDESMKRHPSDLLHEKLKDAFELSKKYFIYKTLKLKEHFKILNQNGLDKLLDIDFQKFLEDNPPIKKTFSPKEELQKLKSLSKEQKKKHLISFKKKLAKQRIAFAKLRIFIERCIEFDHDIAKEKLMMWIKKFSQYYGFDNEQREICKKLINEYYEHRQMALKMREQFSDNYNLVYHLTGIKLPKGTLVKVSVGIMSIDIETDGFNATRLYEKTEKPLVIFKDLGFACAKEPVYYIVINKDKWARIQSFDLTGKKTKKHEYAHIKNALFRKIFAKQEPLQKYLLINQWIESQWLEKDPEIKKLALEEFFKYVRTDALEKVKDEILAYLHVRSLRTLMYDLDSLFLSQNPDSYDYLAYLRDYRKDDPLYQEIAQRMLVQEYSVIIKKAIICFSKLISKGKYSVEEGIALLTDAPLESWSKVTKRLLEYKNRK